MVLIGGQHRSADDDEQDIDHEAGCARDFARIQRPEDHRERDMQRRNLVEWLVEPHEHVEQRPERASGVGSIEGEAMGKRHEARDGDHLRGQQSPGVRVELAARRAKKERDAIQGIDDPVGHDRPWPEWNGALPIEHDGRHVGTKRGGPVGEPVGREEEWSEEREPGERALPGKPLACRGWRRARHEATRRASETVKMPHSSMRWSILRNPASLTSWSISACVRRRITHAAPPRWLVKARAMSSS